MKAGAGTPIGTICVLRETRRGATIEILPSRIVGRLLRTAIVSIRQDEVRGLLRLLSRFFGRAPLFLLNYGVSRDTIVATCGTTGNKWNCKGFEGQEGVE